MRKLPVLADIAPGHKGNAEVGRQLFSEKGCLACHSHPGTETKQGSAADLKTFSPALKSEAQFGPNLGQLTAKLGKSAGDQASSRIWLRQWIKDPHIHSPRSRMPVTHLSNEEAADVAEWLLAQKADASVLGKDWDTLTVGQPKIEDYQDLARVYLKRLLPADYMEKFIKGEKLDANVIRDLPRDEQDLYGKTGEDDLKFYLGKKAVGRLGCYGCHDVPGFEAAKPIGTGLMDWGKKKSDKLAFEDVAKYLLQNYTIKPSIKDKDGKPLARPRQRARNLTRNTSPTP